MTNEEKEIYQKMNEFVGLIEDYGDYFQDKIPEISTILFILRGILILNRKSLLENLAIHNKNFVKMLSEQLPSPQLKTDMQIPISFDTLKNKEN